MNQQRRMSHGRQSALLHGLRAYLVRHLQVFFYSLGQISRAPLTSLMTASVIGIALALPMGLHVLLINLQQVSQGWDGAAQLSLFLKQGVNETAARALATRLEAMEETGSVTYISPEQALEEFKLHSGFGDALNALTENPLPAVLVVYPAQSHNTPHSVERLLQRLRADPEVELAQLDMQWVKRLYNLLEIARRGILILALLLALAVMLIVGNTIRLAVQNRREEIEIMKLIGGTNAFIRRPFLYTGMWYGFTGGIIAWLLISLALSLLDEPVMRLSMLYQSGFALQYLDLTATLLLLAGGTSLGLVGSLIVVGQHLNAFEPA